MYRSQISIQKKTRTDETLLTFFDRFFEPITAMFLCENQNVVCYVGFLAVKKKSRKSLLPLPLSDRRRACWRRRHKRRRRTWGVWRAMVLHTTTRWSWWRPTVNCRLLAFLLCVTVSALAKNQPCARVCGEVFQCKSCMPTLQQCTAQQHRIAL